MEIYCQSNIHTPLATTVLLKTTDPPCHNHTTKSHCKLPPGSNHLQYYSYPTKLLYQCSVNWLPFLRFLLFVNQFNIAQITFPIVFKSGRPTCSREKLDHAIHSLKANSTNQCPCSSFLIFFMQDLCYLWNWRNHITNWLLPICIHYCEILTKVTKDLTEIKMEKKLALHHNQNKMQFKK